jgi:hypothetical protein
MSSKEMFALFLRIVGMLGILIIVRHILEQGPSLPVPAFLIVKWVIGVLIALYFLKGAPLIVNFAYSDKSGK